MPAPCAGCTAASAPWRKRSNTWGCTSGAIPRPVSITCTTASPSASASDTRTLPPEPVNLIAFSIRLVTASSARSRSIHVTRCDASE